MRPVGRNRAAGRPQTLVAAAVAAAAVVAAGFALPAAASFSRSSSAVQRVDTATLLPPTDLVGECAKFKGNVAVRLTWTPTTSTAATGYEVLRDGEVVGTAAGASASSFVDVTVAAPAAYSYAVRSVRNYWRSPGTPDAVVTTRARDCR